MAIYQRKESSLELEEKAYFVTYQNFSKWCAKVDFNVFFSNSKIL